MTPKQKNHSNAVKITVRKPTHVATAAIAKLQLGLVIWLMLNCLTCYKLGLVQNINIITADGTR